jgi:uncharacterized membrane protein
MQLMRSLRHLAATNWGTRRRFTPAVLQQIESAIRDVESRHAGEIRCAVETSFDLPELWHDISARQRALQVFGHLGVWDTELNAGVLLYVLMADNDVEIVADRGIAARVTDAEWQAVCDEVKERFRAGDFARGAVVGVQRIGDLLARHFPNTGGDRNELPDQPVLL